jgi:MFS family permease
MTLGAFISSGGAGFMAIKLGRRQCLWLACALCCISNIIMMATDKIGPLYAGRFINGLANGCFMTFSQLYIQESSPAKYRGLFLTIFSVGTSFVSYATKSCSRAVYSDMSRERSSALLSISRLPRSPARQLILFLSASSSSFPPS